MKKKPFIVLFLIMTLVFSCCSCKSESQKEADRAAKKWEQTTSEEKMRIYCALVKESMLLTEDLGENTPYPAMKRSVKGSMMSAGLTMEAALEHAKEVIIQEQAVFWYAKQEGISATNQEVAEFIQENVLEEIQSDENYAVVDAACNQEGITFEDTIWVYENSYKMQYILKKSGVDADEEVAFLGDLIKKFASTEDYDNIVVVLDACGQFIQTGETDKNVLRNGNIYFSE